MKCLNVFNTLSATHLPVALTMEPQNPREGGWFSARRFDVLGNKTSGVNQSPLTKSLDYISERATQSISQSVTAFSVFPKLLRTSSKGRYAMQLCMSWYSNRVLCVLCAVKGYTNVDDWYRDMWW